MWHVILPDSKRRHCHKQNLAFVATILVLCCRASDPDAATSRLAAEQERSWAHRLLAGQLEALSQSGRQTLDEAAQLEQEPSAAWRDPGPDYKSLGKTQGYTGEVESPDAWRDALEKCSWKLEVGGGEGS